MQLMRLGLKKDVRDGMANVTAAMQKAGVDPTDKVGSPYRCYSVVRRPIFT